MSIFEIDDETYDVTETQWHIIQFIADFSLTNRYPPTIREITEALDLGSTSVSQYHINRLVSAGLLLREVNTARTLRLSPEGEDWYELNKEIENG